MTQAIKSWRKFMTQDQLDRLNALWHKSKGEGLDESEKDEQTALREEYIKSVKTNLRSQLDNISIKEPDGTVRKLRKKENL